MSAATILAGCLMQVVAVSPAGWGELVSLVQSPPLCLDTACGCAVPGCKSRDRIDLYSCSAGPRNERFRYDSTDHTIRVGPGDDGPGGHSEPGWCLQGKNAAQQAKGAHRSCPLSSVQARCNTSEPTQYFEYDASSLELRSRGGLCLQAGLVQGGPNPTVTLAKCTSGSAAQQWNFRRISYIYASWLVRPRQAPRRRIHRHHIQNRHHHQPLCTKTHQDQKQDHHRYAFDLPNQIQVKCAQKSDQPDWDFWLKF